MNLNSPILNHRHVRGDLQCLCGCRSRRVRLRQAHTHTDTQTGKETEAALQALLLIEEICANICCILLAMNLPSWHMAHFVAYITCHMLYCLMFVSGFARYCSYIQGHVIMLNMNIRCVRSFNYHEGMNALPTLLLFSCFFFTLKPSKAYCDSTHTTWVDQIMARLVSQNSTQAQK